MGKDPAAALRESMSKILALLRRGSKAERKKEEANQLRWYERRELVRRLQARRDAN